MVKRRVLIVTRQLPNHRAVTSAVLDLGEYDKSDLKVKLRKMANDHIVAFKKQFIE